jgi:hypothetical protein
MDIIIRIVPKEEQRYETAGDWQFHPTNGDLIIKVSKMSDWRYEMCVAIHELTEALLCKQNGVTEQQVDNWDFSHPEAGSNFNETGAPYEKEHYSACIPELILGKELGINYDEYLKELEGE